MFNFFNMSFDREQRKIANDIINEVIIDTCLVTDNPSYPYETGICSKFYNNGGWIIVEQYKTKDEAELGHKKWIKEFKNGLPKQLKDISACEIANILKRFSNPENFIYHRKDK